MSKMAITTQSTETQSQSLLSIASLAQSFITHQRRPAIIPIAVDELSPEDVQSIRMRTGFVIPVAVKGAELQNKAEKVEAEPESVRPSKRKAEEFEEDLAAEHESEDKFDMMIGW